MIRRSPMDAPPSAPSRTSPRRRRRPRPSRDVGIRFAVKLADGTWLPEDDPAQFTVVKLGSDFTLEVSPDGYLRFTPN